MTAAEPIQVATGGAESSAIESVLDVVANDPRFAGWLPPRAHPLVLILRRDPFSVVLVPAAFWVGRSWVETALLAGSVVLVLIVELLNSGIEAAIDRVSFELHELSKRAKDLASAAVMLSLLLCAGIWAAAIWHHLMTA